MERLLKSQLSQWFKDLRRRPLILKGARQVGKTYLIREFAREHSPNFCEINFEEDNKLITAFEQSLDPDIILNELSLRLNRHIAQDDLLFFDEVQECPKCLTALKYLAERRPQQPVIAAGSLLGLSFSGSSFPVGKVDYLWLGPMSFEEFLLGLDDDRGLQTLNKARTKRSLTEIGHEYLWDRLKQYYVTGGMPRAVMDLKNSVETNPFHAYETVRQTQAALLRDYQSDFSKHSGKASALHINSIFSNVPLQLAAYEDRSTGKYKFSHADLGKNTGYKRLQTPIEWLIKAGLHYRVRIANQAHLPLDVYCKDSVFKLYVFDIGVLGTQLRLPPGRIIADDYGQFKGYFAETLVLQGLIKDDISFPFCWNEGKAEIEFLITHGDRVVPVEVKSGRNTQAKSLASFIKRYSPKSAVKLHRGTIGYDPKSKIHTLPIYLAWDLQSMDI